MAMIHERDVRLKIAAVLRSEISIEDFARWIMSNSWNMQKDSSERAVDLVSSIHLLLAERDEGVYSPEEFRRELASLLDKIIISVPLLDVAIVPQLASLLDNRVISVPIIGGLAIAPRLHMALAANAALIKPPAAPIPVRVVKKVTHSSTVTSLTAVAEPLPV
jgi:hypothetical protein